VLLWWDDEWVVWLVLKKWFVGWGKKKKHVLVFASGSTQKATRRLPNVPSPSGCVGVACWIGLNTIWLEERGNVFVQQFQFLDENRSLLVKTDLVVN